MRATRWIPEIAVAVLAVALRVPGIVTAHLSRSEGRVLLFARDGWGNLWQLFTTGADRHFGCSFSYIAMIKYAGAGESALAARGISLACGLAAIVVVYFLVCRVFGLWQGRLAALLIAVFPHHIYASRVASPAAVSIFLFVLALYFLWRIYEGETGAGPALGYLLSMALALNLHYHAAALLIPANILFYGFARDRMKNIYWWSGANIVLAGLCAFWAQRWMGGIIGSPTGQSLTLEMAQMGVLAKEELLNLMFRFMFFEKYVQILYALGGLFNFELQNGWSVLGVVLVPLVFHYFPFLGFREYEDGYRPRVFAFVVLVFVLCGTAALTFAGVPRWDYIPVAAVMFMAVTANGAARYGTTKWRIAFGLMVLSMWLGFAPGVKKAEAQRPDWERAEQVLLAGSEKELPIVFTRGWESLPFLYVAPGLEERTVNLFRNFDMEFIGQTEYRQEEIISLFGGTIDAYPPDGVKRALDQAGEAWVFQDTREGVEKPKHTHEYDVWLQGNADIIREVDLGGGMKLRKCRVRGGR